MNWLAMLLAYAGAIITGIGKHAGDDINTDDYGMNQTDILPFLTCFFK